MSKKIDLTVLEGNINKRFGKGTFFRPKDGTIEGVELLSTGSMKIDDALGGGVPFGRIIEIYGGESSGKAQPLYSKILTPDGFIEMRDVKKGTIVNTPCGDTTTVIGVYPQGVKKIYRITLDDKTTADCCEDHLWFVTQRGDNRYKKELGQVLSVKELLESGLKHRSGQRKYKVPAISSQKFNNSELPVDPYLMGILLGDGSFRRSNGIKVSNTDEEILSAIKKICKRDFDNLKLSKKRGFCDYGLIKIKRGHSKTVLYKEIEKMGLTGLYSYEKFIPDIYLKTSKENRIALLQGLMDSDGTAGKNGTISYTSTSKQLSEDFEFLTRSLGLRVTTSSRVTQYTSKTGNKVDGRESYRSNILKTTDIDFDLFRLSRKLERVGEECSQYSNRFIESIEEVGEAECQCIMVGHPDSLYVTDNFIPTHNTTCSLQIMAQAQKLGHPVAFIDAEHALDRDYAEQLGVDLDNVYLTQPDCGEDALEILDMILDDGQIKLVVVDSVAALVPRQELEGEMGGSSMGTQARLMSQACRKITGKIGKANCIVIFINQTRMKIGVMYGNPETTTGGNALKFYASQRLEVRRKNDASLKDKNGDLIGHTFKLKVVKNKIAPPFRTAECTLIYGEGISRKEEIIDYATEFEILKKSGSWYAYEDAKIAQGKANLRQFLEDNPEVLTELEVKVKEKLNEDA